MCLMTHHHARTAVRTLLTGGILAIAAPAALGQNVDELWNTNCASCHGSHGQGSDKAKSLLDDPFKSQRTARQMFDSVRTGHGAYGVESFEKTLKGPQIWAVVNRLSEFRNEEYRGHDGGPKAEQGVYHSRRADYRVEDVVGEGLSVPWSVEFIPDLGDPAKEPLSGAMLVTERDGRLRVLTFSKGELSKGRLSAAVEGTPEVFHGHNDSQAGLMDICLHPEYRKNQWVYLSYSDGAVRDGKDVAMTKVIRGRLAAKEGGGWVWKDERVVFQARPEHYLSPGVHYGSRIAFDPHDPTILFFTIGERGRQDMAQDIKRPNGKVHRVRDDGSIPKDNPLAASSDADIYKSIWSFGHRNPQGLCFDLEGNLWDTEHGPRGGDELNLIRKGRNYGWPVVTFGINYNGNPWNVPWPDLIGRKEASLASDSEAVDSDAIAMPVHAWLPSIAACGLTVSTGGVFPEWKGDLLAGGLAGKTVQRLRCKDGVLAEREEILYNLGRVRDVVCGPDGAIYVVLNEPDKVVRVVPAGGK